MCQKKIMVMFSDGKIKCDINAINHEKKQTT